MGIKSSATSEGAFIANLLISVLITAVVASRRVGALSLSLPQTGRAPQRRQLPQWQYQRIRQSALRNSQTEQDIAMEDWYVARGIAGTSRISLRTGEASVGGRGLFWTSDGASEQGDILALVPSSCVIAASNLRGAYPELAAMEESDEASWQAKLTTYARFCQADPTSTRPAMGEWIESWTGGGPGAPRPSSEYTTDELKELADLADAPIETAREAVDERYKCMKRDWEAVGNFYKGDESDFAGLYSIVVSRTARLGPEWRNEGGVIPLHDMCNHPPFRRESNVELFCVGDVRRMIGDNDFKTLMREFFSGVGGASEYGDSDVLLVASGRIRSGDELWLNYKSRTAEMEKEEKLWSMLQYGFPFHL